MQGSDVKIAVRVACVFSLFIGYISSLLVKLALAALGINLVSAIPPDLFRKFVVLTWPTGTMFDGAVT